MVREETIRGLSTGELIRRLVNDVSGLIDREILLARAEARADVRQAATGAGALALGVLLLYTALAAVIVAIILASAPTLAPVLAALVSALVFAVLGAIVALIGWSQIRIRPLERTRETLREDVEWARSRTR